MRLLVICLVVLAVFGAGGAVILVKKLLTLETNLKGLMPQRQGKRLKRFLSLLRMQRCNREP
jgi:hypothetical protein